VIAFDYPGIGKLDWPPPPATVAELCPSIASGSWTALGLTTVDVLGLFHSVEWSPQQMASSHPEMVPSHPSSAGPGPRGGEKLTFTELSIDDLKDPARLDPEVILHAERSQSGRRSRISGPPHAPRSRSGYASHQRRPQPLSCERSATGGEQRHHTALSGLPITDRYAMLGTIRQPTLIVHGAEDCRRRSSQRRHPRRAPLRCPDFSCFRR